MFFITFIFNKLFISKKELYFKEH